MCSHSIPEEENRLAHIRADVVWPPKLTHALKRSYHMCVRHSHLAIAVAWGLIEYTSVLESTPSICHSVGLGKSSFTLRIKLYYFYSRYGARVQRIKRADIYATSTDYLENLWGFHASRGSSTVGMRMWRRTYFDECKGPLQKQKWSPFCDTFGLLVYHHSVHVIRTRCIYEVSTSGDSDTATVAQCERSTKRLCTPIYLRTITVFSYYFSPTPLEQHHACCKSPAMRRIIQAIWTWPSWRPDMGVLSSIHTYRLAKIPCLRSRKQDRLLE